MGHISPVIVHEWIEETGGAEKVLEAFAGLLPDAEITCLWNDAQTRFASSTVRQSPLAYTPLRRTKMLSMPFQPLMWHWVPGRYDFALISTHLFAHHARFFESDPEMDKFIYVHTPARYIWTPELDPRGRGLAGAAARPVLRRLDRLGIRGNRSVVANSRFVADRIRATWGEEARVIHPPADVTKIVETDWTASLSTAEAELLDGLPAVFAFSVGRLVGYKGFDIVVDFASRTGVPVVLAGAGPAENALRAQAARTGAPVTFVGRVSDALMFELYARSTAFLNFSVEDFGITTVEALASGTPAIARNVGGATEIIEDGVSGVLCDPATADLSALFERAAALDRTAVVDRARLFSAERFDTEISAWIGLDPPDSRRDTDPVPLSTTEEL